MSSIHDLVELYAAGALTSAEVAAFVSHLDDCAECRTRLRDLDVAIEALGQHSTTPAPPDLKARVMDSLPGGPASIDPSPSDITPLPQRTRARRWFAAAAVAILVAALGGYTVRLQTELRHLQEIESVLAAGDLTTLQIPTTSLGSVRFMFSPQRSEGVLAASSLPAPPPDSTYQLWIIGKDGPVSAGIFHPTADGTALVLVRGSLGPGVLLGMTIEPAGGSPAPTSEPLFAEPL